MPNPATTRRTASVVGSGPNGLAAAIVLAQAGLEVDLYEAQPTLGGACRTLPLTLPGFHHDFGSAVHPMAVGSPFFRTLPLEQYGLQWIHPRAPLAHPLDDGSAVLLHRSLDQTAAALGPDDLAWRTMMHPLATRFDSLAPELFGPILHLPRHPLQLGRFGLQAILPATTLARSRFRTAHARALFAGLAAHSFLSLESPLSASFALVLGAAAHAVGWPIPRGGAQSLTDALAAHLTSLGGRIHLSTPIRTLAELPRTDLTLLDVSPRQLVALAPPSAAPHSLSRADRAGLARYQPAPAAFKVDYALSAPIPWTAPACLNAATVHLGGTLDEIVASESAMAAGRLHDHPFVLLVQPTLFDPTRAPEGRHIAWAYIHVPNGYATGTDDAASALSHLESQIERFAPGFRSIVLARHIASPARLEALDANLLGGDIIGGANTPLQLLFRPTRRTYRTSIPGVFLCSASTPPGGGVHGMCGYHAARLALQTL